LTTKKGRQNFLAWKIGNFFRMESKISATGFTTPQTSNQIDAAGGHGQTLTGGALIKWAEAVKDLTRSIHSKISRAEAMTARVAIEYRLYYITPRNLDRAVVFP